MEHTLKKFDVELSELRTRVGRMGEFAIEQLANALRALAEHDVQATRAIVERDVNLNRMDIDLEEMCMQYLALQQPVAGDLRLVAAAMKITTELERIGDRVVNLCEAVHELDGRDGAGSHAAIERMGTLATAMVRDSLSAFCSADSSLAKRVFDQDKDFDALYSDTFRKLVASVARGPVSHDLEMAFLCRDLNEISEHATNIAELVMFMVDGKEIAHMDMHERRASH
jgi:phosphate transport system protein